MFNILGVVLESEASRTKLGCCGNAGTHGVSFPQGLVFVFVTCMRGWTSWMAVLRWQKRGAGWTWPWMPAFKALSWVRQGTVGTTEVWPHFEEVHGCVHHSSWHSCTWEILCDPQSSMSEVTSDDLELWWLSHLTPLRDLPGLSQEAGSEDRVLT